MCVHTYQVSRLRRECHAPELNLTLSRPVICTLTPKKQQEMSWPRLCSTLGFNVIARDNDSSNPNGWKIAFSLNRRTLRAWFTNASAYVWHAHRPHPLSINRYPMRMLTILLAYVSAAATVSLSTGAQISHPWSWKHRYSCQLQERNLGSRFHARHLKSWRSS